MKKIHEVERVDFKDNDLILSVDSNVYRFPLSVISQKLLKATETERAVYQVSPSGYGIRWLVIDEDLSIDGLLRLAQVSDLENKKVDNLFDQTQSLSHLKEITEEDIAAEIESYQRGE